ncbi:MAG TPA: ABC transporter ATP-binding protein [Bacilli bacterium]
MNESAIIRATDLHKSFANQNNSQKILDHISFAIHRGEIVSLLGPSGCGKSTLLNIIGGFIKPDEGKVLFADKPVERPSRNCVMLFQHYGLLPWRSVIKNVEFGLEELPLSAKERRERALNYLRMVGLEDKIDLFPRQLSGGMQQRVAIARALVTQPELILMDEPFGALDTFNRYYLQDELLRIQEKEKTTIIFVTHDIDEAIYLSDRIFIMQPNPGKIRKELKIGTAKPRDRSHDDFQYFRKAIFAEFHFSRPVETIEYII